MGMAAAAGSGSLGSRAPPIVPGSNLLQVGTVLGQPRVEQQQSAQQQQQQQNGTLSGTPTAPCYTPRESFVTNGVGAQAFGAA
jgi:hypothetical protein